MKALRVFLPILFLTAILVPAIRGGETDQGTWITFDQPVAIPGQVLAPGTYWFRVMGNQNDLQMNTVEIYDSNKSHLRTVHTLPVQRSFDTGNVPEYTEVQF